MRTRLFTICSLLILALPVAARAQDDDRPPEERDRRGRHHHSPGLREVSENAGRSNRRGFWLSAGLGVGGESFDARDGLGWSDAESGPFAALKLGGTVGSNVLLGAELSGWTDRYYRNNDLDRSLASLMGIVQWYPAARGDFWLKGGLGFAHSEDRQYFGTGSAVEWKQDGTAFAIGLGYDARVARNVSLTPSLDFTAHRYSDHDERILSLGVAVTFH
jgi:hypothetical protein